MWRERKFLVADLVDTNSELGMEGGGEVYLFICSKCIFKVINSC